VILFILFICAVTQQQHFLHQDRIHISLKTNSQDHRPVEALANELRIVICITEKKLSNITHYSLVKYSDSTKCYPCLKLIYFSRLNVL